MGLRLSEERAKGTPRWEKRKVVFVSGRFSLLNVRVFLRTHKWPRNVMDFRLFKKYLMDSAANAPGMMPEEFEEKAKATWDKLDRKGMLEECDCAVDENGMLIKLYRGDTLYWMVDEDD